MPGPSVRSSSSAGDQSGSFSVTKPAGTTSGDLLLSIQFFNDTNSASQTAHPTGFTLYHHQLSSVSCMTVSYKAAGGSEPSSYSYSAGPGGFTSVYLLAIQGADISGFPDTSVSGFAVGGTADPGSATTTKANDLIIDAFGVAVAATFTPDASLTDLGTVGGSSTVSLDVAYKTQAVAGATANNTAAIGGLGGQWVAFLLAISPGTPDIPLPRQASQRWDALLDYEDTESREHARPFSQWFVPPSPPTKQPSQDQRPLPVLDTWWEQFKHWPVSVEAIPDKPLPRQASQVVVVLPDFWQEWNGYSQSLYAQWFIPPLPASYQPSQYQTPLPVFDTWWEQFTHWPIPQGSVPTPPPTHQPSQRWDDLPDLDYQHYEQFRFQPLPSGIFVSQEGGYAIAVAIINASQVGAYRVQNQIEGWVLYLGAGSPPDLTQPPAAFSATLPFSVGLTPPVSGLLTYYVVVRRQDLYSLQSQNQFTISTVTIDSTGGLYMPPLSTPQSLALYPRAGGNVIVQAVYPTLATDEFPPTSWNIWVDVVIPNPMNPPSYAVAVSGRFLNTTIGPMTPGVYFVMVGVVRASDGAMSPTIYGMVTIPEDPTEVIAVPSGFQAIP